MTLTLGYKYKRKVCGNKVYFVDPYYFTKWNIKNKIGGDLSPSAFLPNI